MAQARSCIGRPGAGAPGPAAPPGQTKSRTKPACLPLQSQVVIILFVGVVLSFGGNVELQEEGVGTWGREEAGGGGRGGRRQEQRGGRQQQDSAAVQSLLQEHGSP